MSFLPLKRHQRVYFLFTRIETKWYLKIQTGFNHMAIAWPISPEHIYLLEPTFTGSLTCLKNLEDLNHKDITVLSLDLVHNPESKLVRLSFQTCATICQYLAGIDLGCKLVQSLYEKLTTESSTYLRSCGIKRVTSWVWKQ